ncbi:inositol 1,4,5-trisphosphate receptor-interacting protein-like 1 [Prinia subflava]|uniref:inositol 1,4,5-trisphosphate receptor-interacting protein-like 1 n=1 Tax=Prinia subflava TaxID=208062 RepID=UPI002FDFF71A
MDTWVLWFLLLQSVLHYPQPVGDGLDKATRLQMEARARFQEEVKMRLEMEVEQLALEQELEQLALEQDVWAQRDLPWSALQHWQVWAPAARVLLVLALWYIWSKRSQRREEREEDNNVNGEENGNDVGHGQEVDNIAANEEGAGGNEVDNEAVNAAVGNEADNHDEDDEIGRMLLQRIQWPRQDLKKGCRWTAALMENLAFYFPHVLSTTFYPVLHRAIAVGSAFEGWSPREQDVVYQVLIPMTPPRGHRFHLETDTEGQRSELNFRIHVEQVCTCGREQQDEQVLCLLHHPDEELEGDEHPNVLQSLCRDSYLDVEKTARWFCQLMRAIWPALPQAHNWHLVLLPSRRSCQFKVSNGQESFRIEMLFGVREDNTDIFAISEPRQGYTPSTIWPESYAVAEIKFFRYIAMRAPPDSLHLKCLQFFTRLQLGLGIDTYTMKTIVMHILSNLPASSWTTRHFVRRLMDISENLRICIEVRRLNHFIIGNQRLPEGINLPLHVLLARQYNLFHHLQLDPVAHSQAMSQYMDLRESLQRILNDED